MSLLSAYRRLIEDNDDKQLDAPQSGTEFYLESIIQLLTQAYLIYS